MSLKRVLSRCLDRFEAGRALKARLKGSAGAAPAPQPPPQATPPPEQGVFAQLRYLHVEASFLCNLKCQMCPRLVEGHKEGFMPRERFQRLTHVFPHLDCVVLTGYGEPLLNPHLGEFVQTVRDCGSKPRLTTNATLLNADKARELLESGLENIHMSIDAGTQQTYERLRVGSKWDKVLRNAENFCRTRDAGNFLTGTAWAFVIMRDNFRELPKAAQLASDLGFHALVTNFIARNALDYEHDQLLHAPDGDFHSFREEFEDVVAQARQITDKSGIELRVTPFHLSYDGACLSDPLHSLFVDWMGNVTPCCQLPVRSDKVYTPAHCFGNIDEQDFLEIAEDPRLQRFYVNWRNKRIPRICQNCYQTMRLPDREMYCHATKGDENP